MFLLLLPISWGSHYFSDCGEPASFSAKTNYIPHLFFFLCRSPDFIMQAVWARMTEHAICRLQLHFPLLSMHRWQLNPSAACCSEAPHKCQCCCLRRCRREAWTPPPSQKSSCFNAAAETFSIFNFFWRKNRFSPTVYKSVGSHYSILESKNRL